MFQPHLSDLIAAEDFHSVVTVTLFAQSVHHHVTIIHQELSFLVVIVLSHISTSPLQYANTALACFQSVFTIILLSSNTQSVEITAALVQ
jgi:hypothetical protein